MSSYCILKINTACMYQSSDKRTFEGLCFGYNDLNDFMNKQQWIIYIISAKTPLQRINIYVNS